MKQRAVVTGGCGFIGSHLLDVLVQQGFETHAIDIFFHKKHNHDNIAHLGRQIKVSEVDIRDKIALDEFFDKVRPDQVYHLAAHHFIPFCNQHPDQAIETNIQGTQNIAQACRAFDVKRLFFASTAAVYGSSEKPHTETEIPNPMDIYGVTKAAGEKIVSFQAQGAAFKLRIGRYFNAIGQRETNPHILPEIVSQLQASPDGPLKLGNVSPKRDYIHAADLASSSFTITNNGNVQTDTVNLGSGMEYSVEELVAYFGAALGRKLSIVTDPAKARKNDRPNLCANISKLNSDYGWKPSRSVKESIGELAGVINGSTAKVFV